MGLDTTHECWRGSYSSFNTFRRMIANEIGENLDSFEGFGGTKSFEDLKHPIEPLLNHSDCDGFLTASECYQVAIGLQKIIDNYKGDDDWFLDRMETFKRGCFDAYTHREVVVFH